MYDLLIIIKVYTTHIYNYMIIIPIIINDVQEPVPDAKDAADAGANEAPKQQKKMKRKLRKKKRKEAKIGTPEKGCKEDDDEVENEADALSCVYIYTHYTI